MWDSHNWAGAQLWDWGRPIVENEKAFENDAFDKDLAEQKIPAMVGSIYDIPSCYILQRSRTFHSNTGR